MLKKQNKDYRKKIESIIDENHPSDEIKFIPGKTHIPVTTKLIGKEELKNAVNSCLDGWFTSGKYASQFESDFSKFMDKRYCLLTNSGSSANLLALSALTSKSLGDRRLKHGDEIITVAAGFPTTVNPIFQNNLVPVFLDINKKDLGIDAQQLKKALSPKVKGIMLAHTLGNPYNIEKVKSFAKPIHGL